MVIMGAQQVKDRSGGSVGGVTGSSNTLGAGTSIRASRIKPRGTGPKDARNIGSNIFTEHSGESIVLFLSFLLSKFCFSFRLKFADLAAL